MACFVLRFFSIEYDLLTVNMYTVKDTTHVFCLKGGIYLYICFNGVLIILQKKIIPIQNCNVF